MTPPAAEFNPYGLHAIRIPLGMVSYPGLSAGAKLLYGRLALYRGRQADGFCRPSLNILAQAMGASTDSVDRWLGELVREGFIERKRRGRAVAECVFLPHSVLVDSAKLRNQDSPDSAEVRNQSEASNSADLPAQFRKSASPNSANRASKSPHLTDSAYSYATENIHHQDIQENVHHQDRDENAFGLSKFDDEGKRSRPRTIPEEDLREVYRRKTGVEIPRDLESRIWELCELRCVTRVELIDALQEHVPNPWRNPAGFLTAFARKINTKRSRPLDVVSTATPGYVPEAGPCRRCEGGYLRFDEEPALREYCECALGRDLQRVDKRQADAQAQPDATATATATSMPKPPESSATSQPTGDLHSGTAGVRNVS